MSQKWKKSNAISWLQHSIFQLQVSQVQVVLLCPAGARIEPVPEGFRLPLCQLRQSDKQVKKQKQIVIAKGLALGQS